MKKMILILISFLLIGCSGKENIINDNKSNNNNVVANITDQISNYIDENPVKISIYLDKDGSLNKVSGKYEATWIGKKDIVVFTALPTDEETPDYDYMQKIWPKYDAMYNGINYKIGWNVNFNLKSGETINATIFKPSDVEYFYDYLEVYLYDDVNVQIGEWHSHLLDNEVKDNTIMDAIKLTAGSKFTEILEPISITVFSYDDKDDFDENGNYIGNSFYKVEVYDN